MTRIPLETSNLGLHVQQFSIVFDKIKEKPHPTCLITGQRHSHTTHGFMYAFKVKILDYYAKKSKHNYVFYLFDILIL